jgi:uncharacterized protein (TIGR03067 family)
MNRRSFALFIAIVLAACVSAPPKPPSIVGQWAPASAELGGQAMPVAAFAGATLRLMADTYEFGNDKGSYAVVATSPPAKMDVLGQEGPNAGRTILAIYEVTGDQLTICYQLTRTGARPAEFKAPMGSQILLVRYTRVP